MLSPRALGPSSQEANEFRQLGVLKLCKISLECFVIAKLSLVQRDLHDDGPTGLDRVLAQGVVLNGQRLLVVGGHAVYRPARNGVSLASSLAKNPVSGFRRSNCPHQL